MLRVVLDTNVLISAIVFRGFSRTIYEYCIDYCIPFTSEWILAEFEEKLEIKFKIPKALSTRTVETVREAQSVILPSTPMPTLSVDIDDNNVLQLCETVGADYLVTGDKQLLSIGQFLKTQIVSPRNFYTSIISLSNT